MARMGRPRKGEEKRTETIMVRLTAAEAKALDAYCEAHDTRRAEIVRDAILSLLAREKAPENDGE